MAKIEKIKKGTATIYPATIPQAVVDPETEKTVREELDERANHGYESNPKSLKEVDDEKADHGYDVEETQKTLKEVDTLATQNAEDISQLAGDVEQNSYVKITNLVTNGNFSNGLNGWSVTGQGTASYSNNLATIAGTGTGPINLVQNTVHEASPNDKIYVKAKRKRIVGEQALFFRFESRSGGQVTAIQVSSPFGEYSYDSILATLQEVFVEGNLRFAYQSYFGSGVSNLGTSSEIGNIVVVNLTKTFGAGNEPTKEEMDLLISILGIDYFEGEITIPAQKIMQWELALIRKNKNAIIALGGTII